MSTRRARRDANSPPSLSDEDRTLLARAMQGVRPLHRETREPVWQPPAKPARPRLPQRQRAGQDPSSSRELPVPDAPTDKADRKLRKQIERGQLKLHGKLDLHGKTVVEAHGLLHRFIDHASRHGERYLLIVHGKGFNSPQGLAILKPNVQRWLAEHPAVSRVTYAALRHGGSGASYVVLREPAHR